MNWNEGFIDSEVPKEIPTSYEIFHPLTAALLDTPDQCSRIRIYVKKAF